MTVAKSVNSRFCAFKLRTHSDNGRKTLPAAGCLTVCRDWKNLRKGLPVVPALGGCAIIMPMEGLEKAKLAVDIMAEHGGADIALLDIRRQTVVADFFVLCSAESTPQLRAIVEHIERDLDARGESPLRSEGKGEGGWVVLDYGDVMVHVFSSDMREYYHLERLWSQATTILRVQ